MSQFLIQLTKLPSTNPQIFITFAPLLNAGHGKTQIRTLRGIENVQPRG